MERDPPVMEMRGEDGVEDGRRERVAREREPSAIVKREAPDEEEMDGLEMPAKENSLLLISKGAWLYVPVSMVITLLSVVENCLLRRKVDKV
jgi:hypothetical protein